jgi:hypothetical protein
MRPHRLDADCRSPVCDTASHRTTPRDRRTPYRDAWRCRTAPRSCAPWWSPPRPCRCVPREPGRTTRFRLVFKTLDAPRIVTDHPVAQCLPRHPGCSRGHLARNSLQRHRRPQQTPSLFRIPTPASCAPQFLDRMIAPCDIQRHCGHKCGPVQPISYCGNVPAWVRLEIAMWKIK